jgi:Papain family cysteine protease
LGIITGCSSCWLRIRNQQKWRKLGLLGMLKDDTEKSVRFHFAFDSKIIQNSWKASWGEKGFGRVLRNKNLCNIASDPKYPVLKTSSSKLRPIKAPKDCAYTGEVQKEGVYLKSYCISEFIYSYDEGLEVFLMLGSRIYRFDTPEAKTTLLNDVKKYYDNFSDIFMYVDGKDGNFCSNINNFVDYNTFVVEKSDCKMIKQIVFEFIDITST